MYLDLYPSQDRDEVRVRVIFQFILINIQLDFQSDRIVFLQPVMVLKVAQVIVTVSRKYAYS